ncbi:MAG: type II toxin-antitoxin system HicB family antitoxin [Candidatus Bathyarchaeota archaeon]|nr:type II toxin-antitoxin system HicB family antitoxin [Candidatus Bathyarchaeota archaeon]
MSTQPQKFTILLKEAPQGGFDVHCVEVPIVCHGKTKDEALKTIKEAIESLGWKLTQTS